MSEFRVTIQDEDLRDALKNIGEEAVASVDGAVRQTAIWGLSEIKRTWPKRSGGSRESFGYQKTGKFSFTISSDYKPVLAVDQGAPAHTIYPRQAKMLTIPIRKDVLTSTGSQIKQSALNKLFSSLKKRNGRSVRQIFDEAGIVLAKKAKIPRLPARNLIRDIYVPKIGDELEKNVADAIERAL